MSDLPQIFGYYPGEALKCREENGRVRLYVHDPLGIARIDLLPDDATILVGQIMETYGRAMNYLNGPK